MRTRFGFRNTDAYETASYVKENYTGNTKVKKVYRSPIITSLPRKPRFWERVFNVFFGRSKKTAPEKYAFGNKDDYEL